MHDGVSTVSHARLPLSHESGGPDRLKLRFLILPATF